MDKDRFDHKMIDIEQKSFELGMLMSVFAFEILETFENGRADVSAYINIINEDGLVVQLETEEVSLNRDTGVILIKCINREEGLSWDDLDLSAKNTVINELHFRYKSDNIFNGLSDDGGVH